MNTKSLDLSRLENVRQTGDDYQARCPACAEDGRDGHGRNHLRIFKDGRFGCAVDPGDSAHRKRIWKLAGNGSIPRINFEKKNHEEIETPRMARAQLTMLIDRFWSDDLALLLGENPQPFDDIFANTDPCYFLACLFRDDDILWTGDPKDSGSERFASHWKKLRDIKMLGSNRLQGSFTTPSTFKPKSTSRALGSIEVARYLILDFDEINGKKPETSDEIYRLFRQSIAVVQWLRKKLHWELAAIVHTGNKGIHAWFHNPGDEPVASLKKIHEVFGIDRTLNNPVQPCRLPGQIHQKSGRLSRVLWLQRPDVASLR